ncbi:conserved hypothetical protein [Candidatus Terasakiella magnetica]|uniref:Membrane-anchored protein n=1 Tax=Candidatus Terasakiella magnetica TaxID=1867952 RepID=A0A1C3RLK2_9PROT|nr:DUF3422 domain-containing protein [Candidatus Terasakiella magnetica]SCA58182.1 conserved hypothetical protein [Candidatus Terasakiella magnetica]
MHYLGQEHPLRDTLDKEINARPYIPLSMPERVSHIALKTGETGGVEERDHLGALCEKYDVPPPPDGATHFIADMGPFRLRWERHTEFSTYTFFRSEVCEEPFLHPVIELVSKDWLAEMPGEVINAVHLELEHKDTPRRKPSEISRLFGGQTYIGCSIGGGAAEMCTDLRIQEDRFGRILMRDVSMTARQAGRTIQRVLEIETYRFMALLGLPFAREASPDIRRIDDSLAEIAGKMSDKSDEFKDGELLEDLSTLAAEIESISAHNSYRFGATRAYYAIVQQRLNELREDRMKGLPTLSETIERRMAPAMKTCEYTATRQDFLSRRVTRVAGLLRARVEVELEKQNQEVLETMNKRAGLQLRLQETVEGLSVVAISYYLIGLLGYGFKAAKAAGLPINPDIAVGVAVPVVAFLIWSGLRKAKKILLSGG